MPHHKQTALLSCYLIKPVVISSMYHLNKLFARHFINLSFLTNIFNKLDNLTNATQEQSALLSCYLIKPAVISSTCHLNKLSARHFINLSFLKDIFNELDSLSNATPHSPILKENCITNGVI